MHFKSEWEKTSPPLEWDNQPDMLLAFEEIETAVKTHNSAVILIARTFDVSVAEVLTDALYDWRRDAIGQAKFLLDDHGFDCFEDEASDMFITTESEIRKELKLLNQPPVAGFLSGKACV